MQNSFDSQFGSLEELFSDNWGLVNPPQQAALDLDFWLTADLAQSITPANTDLGIEPGKVEFVEEEEKPKTKKRKAAATEKKERIVLDEEEKRRRNVLASQKFRAEKKKKDSQMMEINHQLQARIHELEILLREKEVEINVMRTLIKDK